VVDGVDDNERIIGTIGVKPNVEGIQEITVQTNSYAAEAGRTAGGVINVVTRSGTNQFHGSVYEYFRNDALDGRNFFQRTGNKPELRQNQYGASIGGPIFRDRTFFYFD
jgi:outer membrane receptor for ferrienterochelin and colicin